LPGYCRDLRKRKTQPYSGPNPIQARWRHPEDPRIRRERSFPTKREARAWLAEQDTDAQRGVWTDPNAGRETFAAVAELWLEASRFQVAPKTRDNNVSMLRCHLLPEFAERRLAGIDAADVQRYVNRLGERRAPKTVRHVLVLLHQILDFAVRRRYIATNPCSAVRRPPGRRQRKVTPLPHAELSQLADAMPEAKSRAAILVAGYCGLRAGEVWALRRNDVLLRRLRVDEKITEVQVAKQDTDYTVLPNGLAVGPTKTYSDEPVAMPEVVGEALAQLITLDMAADAFLFTDRAGGPFRQSNWYFRVYKPVLVATLPPEYHDFTFHDLRHTCAAYLIEMGFHPKVIQQQMRHTSIQTTMDVYGHLFPDGLDAVADALDAGYRARLDSDSMGKKAAPVTRLKASDA
jgi:integrase